MMELQRTLMPMTKIHTAGTTMDMDLPRVHEEILCFFYGRGVAGIIFQELQIYHTIDIFKSSYMRIHFDSPDYVYPKYDGNKALLRVTIRRIKVRY